MVILAPLSLPITVIVVVRVFKVEPKRVLIVVPVNVNEVPITDLDKTAPVVVFKDELSVEVDVIPVLFVPVIAPPHVVPLEPKIVDVLLQFA